MIVARQLNGYFAAVSLLDGLSVLGAEGPEVFDYFIRVGVIEADHFEIGQVVAVGIDWEEIDRRVGDGVFSRLIALE